MKLIKLSDTTLLTRAGAYLRFDRYDVPADGENTPNIIETRWIDPDDASTLLSQAGKYYELKGYFEAWHKLPNVVRDEWIKSQRDQNPYGGIMPGAPEVDDILRNA